MKKIARFTRYKKLSNAKISSINILIDGFELLQLNKLRVSDK